MKIATDMHGDYVKYIKTRLNLLRFSGLLMSLVGVALVLIQHFGLMSGLWNCVSILYICGFLFTTNAQYLDMRQAKGFAKASRLFAMLFYIATVAMLVLILLDRFLVIAL